MSSSTRFGFSKFMPGETFNQKQNPVFFQFAQYLRNQNDPRFKFSDRFRALGIELDDIPDRFLDPITKEVMDNPTMVSNQKTYDETTIKRVNYIDPYSREKITPVMANLRLRAEIEAFLKERESRANVGAHAGAAAAAAAGAAAGDGTAKPAAAAPGK